MTNPMLAGTGDTTPMLAGTINSPQAFTGVGWKIVSKLVTINFRSSCPEVWSWRLSAPTFISSPTLGAYLRQLLSTDYVNNTFQNPISISS